MKKPILSLFLVFIVLNFIFAGTVFAVQKRSRAKGPTDEKIRLAVVKQLAWDNSLDASNIQVEVADGKVILTGTVPTYEKRVNAAKNALDVCFDSVGCCASA